MYLDFSKSFISWKTYQNSEGKFRIAATLVHQNQRWLLGEEVMACNVYAADNLFKNPSYNFQAAASGTEWKIFRSYTAGGATGHSRFSSRDQFAEEELYESCLSAFNVISPQEAYTSLSTLQCEVTASDYQIQFPVKHMNYDRSSGAFQVETGKVLVPYENDLRLAFAAFNRLDKLELLIRKDEANENMTQKIDCSIKLITT